MIAITDIKKKFGKVEVLKGINLEIDHGGIFAILGPNGSGKTTLIKSVLGMVVPDGGDISIDGVSILGGWAHRNEINYMSQIADFPPNLKVTELVSMIRNLRPKEAKIDGLIELFGLTPFLDKKLGHLSGGTRQKVNILLTFMFESNIIILDEPTTGLDPISLLHLKQIINQERDNGKTILITSHIMSFVEEVADEIVFLLEGKIYFKGTLDILKEKTKQPTLELAVAHLINPNYA